MAAISAFYRELALIQTRAGALLAAFSRRDHRALETIACEAAATWQVSHAAIQLVEFHAGDLGEVELARRALEASCRVLLFLFQHVRTSMPGGTLDAARLHEVLGRLEAVLKRALDLDKAAPVEPAEAEEQALNAESGGGAHE